MGGRVAPHSLDVLLFSKLIDLPFGMILPTGCITAREIQSTFGCDFNQNKLSIYLSISKKSGTKEPRRKKNREVTVNSSLGKTMGENDTRDYNEF